MDIISLKTDFNIEFEDDQDLLKKLQKLYTIDGYTPQIKIEGDLVYVHVDDAVYEGTKKSFNKAMGLCNKHDFDRAKPILQDIVKQCPLHADAFRVLGQIEMDRSNYTLAEEYILKALIIDPANLYALVLMGNVHAAQGDIEVADIYYKKVLEYHPEDIIAKNNVAANYIRVKRYDEAIPLFKEIIEKDQTYINCYYGLALCYYETKKLEDAVNVCIEGMKKGVNRPQDRDVREELQKLAMTAARKFVAGFDYRIEVGLQQQKLAQMTDVPLRIETDENLNVHARMEYYIARKRDYNRVVYNPKKQYHEHLLMHEFMHLEMNLEASKAGSNKLAITGSDEMAAFRRWISSDLKSLKGKLTSDHLDKFVEQLANGLLLQAMNSPLDLLVEDRIYNNYPKMRPLQMLSLVAMELENVDSVKKAVKSELPKKVVSANRIMNIVSALHLQELYGFNIAPHYAPSGNERKIAEDLYAEYKAYRDDYKPGEEYDLLEYFVETLGFSPFLKLVSEMHFKEIGLPDISELPDECIDPESHDEQNAAFAENHKGGEDPTETMMMAMYMLGALEYMDDKPYEDIHRIAIEIAIVGMKGINPANSGYSIQAIPGRTFGGYEFLAYYYVSWAKAIPEKIDSLGLPFKTAYETAKDMYNKKKGN